LRWVMTKSSGIESYLGESLSGSLPPSRQETPRRSTS